MKRRQGRKTTGRETWAGLRPAGRRNRLPHLKRLVFHEVSRAERPSNRRRKAIVCPTVTAAFHSHYSQIGRSDLRDYAAGHSSTRNCLEADRGVPAAGFLPAHPGGSEGTGGR